MPVAIYRAEFGEMRWAYALFADKLIANRSGPIDKKQLIFDLGQCDAMPDRSVTVLYNPLPSSHWGLAPIIMIANLAAFGWVTFYLVLQPLMHAFPGEVAAVGVSWVALLVLESFAALWLFTRLVREEMIQYHALFKRFVNG